MPDKINHREEDIYNNTNIYNTEQKSDNSIDNINNASNLTEDDINTISFDDNYYLYKNTKLYICPRNCDFACKERNIMLHHLSRVYKCTKIKTDKYIKENLNEEVIEDLIQKNNIKYYICDDCNKYFISASKLNRHRISQEGCKNIYQCEKCDREFRNIGDFNVHIRNIYCLNENGECIHLESNNVINQNENNSNLENSNSNNDLDYEIINHNDVKLYKCRLCQKICSSYGNIKSHLNKKNKCNLIHKCHKCNREFHSLENFNKHLRQKINCENQLFSCTKCKKIFTTNRNLLKHIKNINCNG